MPQENITYPGIIDRIKAVFTDTIFMVLFMFLMSIIFSSLEHVPDAVRAASFIFIFLFYDPIFTSAFGGTIGHLMNGIRVKQEKDEVKNIPFHFAFLRFIAKALLGWISLLTMNSNTKRKAIHDYMASSVVIFNKQDEQEMQQ
jgi:uncharacterized RDD family membrane protein YckC